MNAKSTLPVAKTRLELTRRAVLGGAGAAGIAALADAYGPGAPSAQAAPNDRHEPLAGRAQLVVLYGSPSAPEAFERYYRDTHVPLAIKIPGLLSAMSAVVLAAPDESPAPYYRVAALTFADAESLQVAASSAEAAAVLADIPNFATGGATVMMAEVDLVYPDALEATPGMPRPKHW